MPTVKMMGTANNTIVGDSSVAFPSEPVKGKSRKRDGYVLPLALNPGTAKKRIELTLRRREAVLSSQGTEDRINS